jgi:hypothetical protein
MGFPSSNALSRYEVIYSLNERQNGFQVVQFVSFDDAVKGTFR